MKPVNLVSVFNSNSIFYELEPSYATLKKHENSTLMCFVKELISSFKEIPFELLENYYLSYKIQQIEKEFDLLRFSDDSIINIELKSKQILSDKEMFDKILKQMRRNHYYLKMLNKNVSIYTYVEGNLVYKYNELSDTLSHSSISTIRNDLASQKTSNDHNPDDYFKPSNYLISPFNNTQRFINDAYFLNDAQEKIKAAIKGAYEENNTIHFCLTANAGTGKTLLLFDIAKSFLKDCKNSPIIHCGTMNSGHISLRDDYDYKIHAIKEIDEKTVKLIIPNETDIILIDESHRINTYQLNLIIKRALDLNVMIVFSYDSKQYLKKGEDKDIYEYVSSNYPELALEVKKLTNKIRTNKEMASFITNLFNIGKSNHNLNYENVSIEYFNKYDTAKSYMRYLMMNDNWTPITFSASNYNIEPITKLAEMGFQSAHKVIGQEFNKVVFCMDNNFNYHQNILSVSSDTHYSIRGMLYQIVTRVISELKIIVIDNPELYLKLCEIKSLSNSLKDTPKGCVNVIQ